MPLTGAIDAELQRSVEAFLYREARLLDEGALEEWLALFTEDGRYWLPCNTRDLDPEAQISLIYDDRPHLAERVYRITSGASFTQSPRSKVWHSVTNVLVSECEGDGDRLVVDSTQLVVELRRGRQTIFATQCRHELRCAGDDLRIALKRVELLDLDEPISSLTFIL